MTDHNNEMTDHNNKIPDDFCIANDISLYCQYNDMVNILLMMKKYKIDMVYKLQIEKL